MSKFETNRNFSTNLSHISQKTEGIFLGPFLPFLYYLVAFCFKFPAFFEAIYFSVLGKGYISDLLFIAFRKLAKVRGVIMNHFLVHVYSLYIKKIIVT